VAIVGPKGSGKTTLLEELSRNLTADTVMVRIPGSSKQPWRTVKNQLPAIVGPEFAVLIDGAEQLGGIGWRRLLYAARRARYLIATLHRPGLLPTLIDCRTEPGLLRDLVCELVPEDAPTLEPELNDLFARHDGNIRSCFRELYDVYGGRSPMSSRAEVKRLVPA
jgi:GTPase SAR1 family protein